MSRHGASQWLSAGFVILAVSGGIHAITPLNHDVAGILWGAREMLAGAEFGRDIIDSNPPLAWWLSMPAVVAAKQSGLPLILAFQAYVALIVLAAIAVTHLIARSWVVTIAAMVALFLFSPREYGQRDVLAATLALPYLALVSARLGGERPPAALSVAVGVAAGIGFGLKPFFLIVPALAEAFAWSRRVGPARPELAAMAGTLAAYAVAVWLFAPAYVSEIVPLVRATYWATDVPLASMIQASPVTLAGIVVASLAAWRSGLPPLATVFGLAAIGFYATYLGQMKGNPYHLVPATTYALLALACYVERPMGERLRVLVATGLLLMFVTGTFNAGAWVAENRRGSYPVATFLETFQGEVAKDGRGGFLVVTMHPYPAFPTALTVDSPWVSNNLSYYWFLPAIAKVRAGDRPDMRAGVERAEPRFRGMMQADIARRPSVVFVDALDWRPGIGALNFDVLAYLNEDPRYAAEMALYREAKPVGPFRRFVRAE